MTFQAIRTEMDGPGINNLVLPTTDVEVLWRLALCECGENLILLGSGGIPWITRVDGRRAECVARLVGNLLDRLPRGDYGNGVVEPGVPRIGRSVQLSQECFTIESFRCVHGTHASLMFSAERTRFRIAFSSSAIPWLRMIDRWRSSVATAVMATAAQARMMVRVEMLHRNFMIDFSDVNNTPNTLIDSIQEMV